MSPLRACTNYFSSAEEFDQEQDRILRRLTSIKSSEWLRHLFCPLGVSCLEEKLFTIAELSNLSISALDILLTPSGISCLRKKFITIPEIQQEQNLEWLSAFM